MSSGVQRGGPTTPSGWRRHWQSAGQPWRIEPEITIDRQRVLDEKRSQAADVAASIYPFADRNIKLTRADVEWLLATHTTPDGITGPVDPSNSKHRNRMGLDLRGANLSEADLHRLPLARLQGGLKVAELEEANAKQRDTASVRLNRADLRDADLRGAVLTGVSLEKSNLMRADMSGAECYQARFKSANLTNTILDQADLRFAYFDESSQLSHTSLRRALLANIRWNGVDVGDIDWTANRVLGDELYAAQQGTFGASRLQRKERINRYQMAMAANRQVAVLLESQKSSESDVHLYRAELLQRRVYRLRRQFGSYFRSCGLDALAGYGYRPLRLVGIYIGLLVAYAALYFALTQLFSGPIHPLAWNEALILSLQVVIGRATPDSGSLLDPINLLADSEILLSVVVGLVFSMLVSRRYFK